MELYEAIKLGEEELRLQLRSYYRIQNPSPAMQARILKFEKAQRLLLQWIIDNTPIG